MTYIQDILDEVEEQEEHEDSDGDSGTVEIDVFKLLPKFCRSESDHYLVDYIDQGASRESSGGADVDVSPMTEGSRRANSMMRSTSYFIPARSVYSTGSVVAPCMRTVTDAEMQEAWLLCYSAFSITNPNNSKGYGYNSRGETDAIRQLKVLRDLSCTSVLELLSQVKRLH